MRSLEQYRVQKLFESSTDPSLAIRNFVNDNAKERWEGLFNFFNKYDMTVSGDRIEAMDHINDLIAACNMLKSMITKTQMK